MLAAAAAASVVAVSHDCCAHGLQVNLGLSLLLVIAAITLGISCGGKRPEWRAKYNFAAQLAGLGLLVLSSVFSSRDDPIWNRSVRP